MYTFLNNDKCARARCGNYQCLNISSSSYDLEQCVGNIFSNRLSKSLLPALLILVVGGSRIS